MAAFVSWKRLKLNFEFWLLFQTAFEAAVQARYPFFFLCGGFPGRPIYTTCTAASYSIISTKTALYAQKGWFHLYWVGGILISFFFPKIFVSFGIYGASPSPQEGLADGILKNFDWSGSLVPALPPKKDWMSFDYCNEWTGANPIWAYRGWSWTKQHYKLSGQLAGWVSRSFVVQIVDVVQP